MDNMMEAKGRLLAASDQAVDLIALLIAMRRIVRAAKYPADLIRDAMADAIEHQATQIASNIRRARVARDGAEEESTS
mgnify:CR=1 FL=1